MWKQIPPTKQSQVETISINSESTAELCVLLSLNYLVDTLVLKRATGQEHFNERVRRRLSDKLSNSFPEWRSKGQQRTENRSPVWTKNADH